MKISLKMRVFIVFFGVLFLLAGSYLFTVTRFITRFTTKQLNDDYNSLLLEISETMQNLLWNLTLTSGQLLDNDEIQDTVLAYQSSSSPYIRQEYYSFLLKDITMLTMANSDVSLLYLYDNEDEDFIFSSFPVQENRTGELHGKLLLIGASGELLYTNLPSASSALPALLEKGKNADYRSLTKEMSQGWKVSLILPDQIYIRDYYHSLRDVLLCTLLIAVLIGALAFYFWKSVYTPLQLFDRQLDDNVL